MKKSKAISLLLCLSLLASLLIPGTLAMPAKAAEGDTDDGMKISKTAVANNDGTYTITLEAYATGEKFISEVKKDVPTDIILVLDQSGSMTQSMHTYAFREYTNQSNSYLYNRRHNNNNGTNNLYYPLGDGGYAAVSVTRTQGEGSVTYTECPVNWLNGAFYGNENYYANSNNLYIKVGNDYQPVSLERTGNWREYTYTYTFPDSSSFKSVGRDNSPGDFGGRGPLYVRSTTQGDYTYTYTYTDKDGVNQTIGSSTGQNKVPTEFKLYERYSTSSQSRLVALENAVTKFANSVSQKASGEDGQLGTGDDVNHRIAVVGYASRKDSNDPWINTELFIGATQYNYNVDAKNYYGSAFQDMSTKNGQDNVKASIGALDANGATYTNYGLEMANGILNAYPVEGTEKRNRVIVLFTDGYPGKNANDFNQTAADTALAQATIAKNSGVSLYSVGIFDGADATSPGNKYGSNTEAANWFMQQVSSNNGTPRNPSYYLSASDSDTLSNIFEQIAENIETGGSSTTLNENAVVKDIIAPAFSLPTGATAENITLETYSYIGENEWSKNSDAMGATATVNGDQVSVTGFDFAKNYVGTVTENGNVTYRGSKLVISFTVAPKDGFLGGNNVYTNTSAGVYENSSATVPVVTFPQPKVNVPIKDVTVTAQDKNVYLLGSLNAADIQSGATVECGNVKLNLNESNYGLADWQTEYVDITVEIKDKDDNPVADLNALTDDTTYTITATVKPKAGKTGEGASGTANVMDGKIGNVTKNILVFKPELTFQDSEVYYGDGEPTDFSGNKTSEVWKHGETLSTADGVTIIGKKPTLDIICTPESGKIADGKINTKQDIAVDAAVKINNADVIDYTTFQHMNCEGKTCTVPNGKEFLLHVKTCQLTITKTGGADSEPYVFTVKKGDAKYSEVTINGNGSVTIYELPVGTYSIEEDTGWSWRYTGNNGSSATLSAQNSTGSITCTNTKTQDYWLNGYSDVVTNIFGDKH